MEEMTMAKSIFEQLGGTYEQQGDYLLPCLTVPAEKEQPIGVWGATALAVSERIPQSHLHNPAHKRQTEQLPCRHRQAGTGERMDTMLPRMIEAAGVTEELKACNPMRWVGLMNTLKAQVEEILLSELIYQ